MGEQKKVREGLDKKVRFESSSHLKDAGGAKKSEVKSEKKPHKKKSDGQRPDDKKPKELKKEKTNTTRKKPDAPPKKEDAPIPVVLQFDKHCNCTACIRKMIDAVRGCDGVKDVEADQSSYKLTVIGKVDPAKLRGWLADKFKMKVELISPQPQKDAGLNKKLEVKSDKKANEKKSGHQKSRGVELESTLQQNVEVPPQTVIHISLIRDCVLVFN